MTPAASSLAAAPLRIGLLNNLPEAAMAAGTRQFQSLVEAARGELAVSWTLYALEETPRSADAARALAATHGSGQDLLNADLDLLIVTGAEPTADHLTAEPFFDRMREVVRYAAEATLSTFWSCLAAHLAAEVLDAVPRRPLERKRAGVFEVEVLLPGHPLMKSGPARRFCPHSRWNEIGEEDLRRAGYEILTRSPEVGADLFVKAEPSLFLFAQGHPEYAADTLVHELRRDLKRFVRGEQTSFPEPPSGLLPPTVEVRLREIGAGSARRGFGPKALAQALALLEPACGGGADPVAGSSWTEEAGRAGALWREASVGLFSAWLNLAAERRDERPDRSARP